MYRGDCRMKKINKSEIFLNNKFNKEKFEIFVEQNRSLNYLEKIIDSIVNYKNCNEKNIVRIKSSIEMYKAEVNINNSNIALNSIFLSYFAIVINFVNNIYFKNEVLQNLLLLSIPIVLIIILRHIIRKDEVYVMYAYSYLLFKMKLKIAQKNKKNICKAKRRNNKTAETKRKNRKMAKEKIKYKREIRMY